MNILLYCLTVLIWGSTWIAINYQYGIVPVELSIAYRFGLASLVLFVICWLAGKPLRFNAQQHLRFIMLACCIFGINYLCIYSGQKHLNSALVSIIFSTIVMMNIAHSRIFFGTPITLSTVIGAGIGSIGIVVLFWPTIADTHWGDKAAFAIIICLLGSMIASWGNMISIGNQLRGLPVLQTNAWGMGYGALIMLGLALFNGHEIVFDTSTPYLASLFYLAIFGSVIAFGAYFALLTRLGTAKASYASILFPGIAVVISTWVEDFHWSAYTVSGFSLIMLGNIILITHWPWLLTQLGWQRTEIQAR